MKNPKKIIIAVASVIAAGGAVVLGVIAAKRRGKLAYKY